MTCNLTPTGQVASVVTPVPGGVGPCTVACLMANTLLAARLQLGISCYLAHFDNSNLGYHQKSI